MKTLEDEAIAIESGCFYRAAIWASRSPLGMDL
jgi:hypothetical protein